MTQNRQKLWRLVLAAGFLTLALVLPFLTGQFPRLGNALCPMHIPVLLCGFFCGPFYGAAVGFSAPLLRFALFGMPLPVPIGISMAFELAAYGLVSGLLYRLLPHKKCSIYLSLIAAMLTGRIVWGVARVVFYGLGKGEFGWKLFFTGAFTAAVPGILLQLIFIPILVMTLQKVVPVLNRTDAKTGEHL